MSMWKPKFLFNKVTAEKPGSTALFFERLEPKILLSADALSGFIASDPFSDNEENTSLDVFQSADLLTSSFAANAENESAANEPLNLDTLANVIGSDLTNQNHAAENYASIDVLSSLLSESSNTIQSRQEIIFVDAATPDYQQLLDGLTDNPDTLYQVIILQSDQDGIEQISSALNQQQDIDAIHLLSHGNGDGLQLGNVWLSNTNLESYNEQLQQWGDALDQDADLLIYGCDLASQQSGQTLINNLAELTSADVAASDDLTGAASLGGDWTLEYTVGQVENYSTFNFTALQNWSHVLLDYYVNTGAEDLINDPTKLSLREAVILSNDNAGADRIFLEANTTYTLAIASTNENNSADGDLDILDALTITGIDSTTIINGNDIDRVFHVGIGASLSLSNLVIEDGLADGTNDNGLGGAILVRNDIASSLTLDNVILRSNNASEGGAIYNRANSTIDLTNVSIESNGGFTSLSGGGIYNRGFATLDSVTLSGNIAGNGAGIFNDGGDVVLLNTTLSGNIGLNGAAIYNQAMGANPGTLSIENSTLSGNVGFNIANGIFQDATSSVDLKNTILNDGVDNIVGGIVTSQGYNIDVDDTVRDESGLGLTHINDIKNVDPQLGVLADNGGFTKTHALLQGSAAIDPAGLTTTTSVDQRGLARDATPDIGAFEQSYYLDEFTTNESYAGNDGTLTWTNDWQEIGESDGASAGDVYVWKEPASVPQNNLLTFGWDDHFGAWREADLSGAGSAVLSFNWSEKIDPLDIVTLSASTDGGLSWTTIDTFDGSSVTAWNFASYDISNFIDNDTRIKFESTSGFTNSQTFSVDNVKIDLYGIASNAAPTVNYNLSSGTLYAEGANTVTIKNIVVEDADVAEIITATLTLDNISTGALTANDGASYDDSTGIWTITDSVANVNLALANLEFKPEAGNITDTSIAVTIDDGNEDNSLALTGMITLDVSAIQTVVTVTTAADDPDTAATDGLVSLREAIAMAEATPGLVLINFDIAGTGTHTITLQQQDLAVPTSGRLPNITDQVIIDGTSQSGYGGSPMIELNGALVTGDGLKLVGDSDGSVVKGLSIINFGGDGISVGSDDHTIQSNFIGIRADGTEAGNGSGIKLETDGHLIGGSNPGEGNYISGNDDAGLQIQGNSKDNTVYGNFIGINLKGEAAGNGTDGIRVAANSDNNSIGGTIAGQANIIANNVSDGIEVSGSDNVQIRHNIIYDNVEQQINLAGGNDFGINDLPTLTSAEYDAATGNLVVKVEYAADPDNANVTLNLDFFSTPDNDAEGQVYLGSGMIVLDENGAGMMTLESNFNVKPGDYITATATNADGADGTSAFSTAIQVSVANAPVSYNTAPVLDPTEVLTLNSVTQGDSAPSDGDVVGTLVSDLVTLGGNVTDADAAALVGIAVIEADTENGSWYYSTNNGANWFVMSDGSGINIDEEEARLLLADTGTRIYFAPASSYSGTINEAISIRAWDATSGVNGGLGDTSLNGGTSAFSTLYDNVSIVVISSNDTPTVETTIPDQTLAEDFASYTIDLNAAFADVETADAALTFAVSGNTNINVSIASGIATITPTANWNGSETLTFRATDTGSLFVEQAVVFTVNPANDTPTVETTILDQTLVEDFASYTIDLNAAFADVETADAALVYSVTGNTNVNVSIASGIATITPTANWNGNETLTFRATDAGSLFVEQAVLFTVNPVNEIPVATGNSISVNEDEPFIFSASDFTFSDTENDALVSITVSSLNLNGGTFTHSGNTVTVTDGMTITAAQLADLTFQSAFNDSSNSSFSYTVNDADAGVTSAVMSITVNVVNDAPSATNLDSTLPYVDGATSIAITDIVISDFDSGEIITATLTLLNKDSGQLSTSGKATYDAGTGVWKISGTVVEVNKALASVSFLPANTVFTSSDISVVIDDDDEDASGPLLGTLTIEGAPLDVSVVEEEKDVGGTDTETTLPEKEVVEDEVDEVVSEEDVLKREDAKISVQSQIIEEITETEDIDLISLPPVDINVDASQVNNVNADNNTATEKSDTSVTRLRDQMIAFNDPLALTQSGQSFLIKLNDLREEMVLDNENTKAVVGSSLTVSAGFSVGYVVWLARSGVIMSSVLSALPAWRFVDPLPILSSLQDKDDEDEDDESLESIVGEKYKNERQN